MKCKWDELIRILPEAIRDDTDCFGRDTMQEMRIRIGQKIQIRTAEKVMEINHVALKEDISYILNAVTGYSPWAMQTARQGYVTAKGGHRIGICGIGTEKSAGIATPLMLNIRVARYLEDISKPLDVFHGNVLIIGPPGCGKTTLLRDYAVRLSDGGKRISVVDERQELFPYSDEGFSFPIGRNTDILQCVPKAKAAMMLLRTMNPEIIVMDELTDFEEAAAVQKCFHCGVTIVATVHADDTKDYLHRHKQLQSMGIFHQFAVLDSTQHLHLERL